MADLEGRHRSLRLLLIFLQQPVLFRLAVESLLLQFELVFRYSVFGHSLVAGQKRYPTSPEPEDQRLMLSLKI
ncbi:Uncharacterised protein [Streptococcus pneumoniae]|nr:Uncharacterised protein [Streptococcus pneumoniae]CIV90746.1 Uncharacterised protein [Streptococcus pneumoniae]